MTSLSTNSEVNAPATVSGDVHELLRRGDAYVENPTNVECLETHISRVYLTDVFAYKLKKPVKFEFLDFSTVDCRRRACEEELRINSRLAPDVYLGVLPITRELGGELKLAGQGTPIDWVVKMRRLPAEQTLDQLIRRGNLRDAHVESLIKRLLRFYLHAPPLCVTTEAYLQEIEHHVSANREELLRPLHGLDAVTVKRVHCSQLRLLRIFPELLRSRVCDGRIVEGHGDLRPEHVYFCPDPVMIDGIEFNADMRRLDVLDELSFLAMECAALGAAAVGERIVAAYCAAAHDHPPAMLLRFYETYRACVRAKVAALRSVQTSGTEHARSLQSAARYLELAGTYAAETGRATLLVVWGLSGSGKSVLANELAKQLGCDLLQTDGIRRELLGVSNRPQAFNAEQYDVANRQRVYDELFRRAEVSLSHGVATVLDGTFLAARQREFAAEMAARYGADVCFVRCECPDHVAAARVRKRLATEQSDSEIRPELLVDQRELVEESSTRHPSCVVDTTGSVLEIMQQVFAVLRSCTHVPGTKL